MILVDCDWNEFLVRICVISAVGSHNLEQCTMTLFTNVFVRGIVHMTLSYQVLPNLLHTVRTCDDFLKEYIMWKLGTLVSIVRQHVRKYLPDLLSLISKLWSSSFSLPATNRPVHGSSVYKLVAV
ncbi:hypothetical protein ACS0TY_027726 [Phlomoides rotata]